KPAAGFAAPVAPWPAKSAAPAVFSWLYRGRIERFIQADSAEVNPALWIDLDHADLQLISNFHHIVGPSGRRISQVAHMPQPSFAGNDLYKRAHTHEACHFALVLCADLDFGSDAADHLGCTLSTGAVHGGDEYRAVLFDAHVRAGLCFDGLDHLAAGAD